MPHFRGFIAISIDSFPKLREFLGQVKQSGANLKLVETENIHITLKFLGDTEETKIEQIEQIIKDAVKGIDPFEIKLKNVGVFPNERYIKIVWIGIKTGEQMVIIAGKIDEGLSKLGFEKEKRRFSPHLTIARVRSAKNKEKLQRVLKKYKDVEFIDIKVDSIELKKSELTSKGPIYSTLKKVSL